MPSGSGTVVRGAHVEDAVPHLSALWTRRRVEESYTGLKLAGGYEGGGWNLDSGGNGLSGCRPRSSPGQQDGFGRRLLIAEKFVVRLTGLAVSGWSCRSVSHLSSSLP